MMHKKQVKPGILYDPVFFLKKNIDILYTY